MGVSAHISALAQHIFLAGASAVGKTTLKCLLSFDSAARQCGGRAVRGGRGTGETAHPVLSSAPQLWAQNYALAQQSPVSCWTRRPWRAAGRGQVRFLIVLTPKHSLEEELLISFSMFILQVTSVKIRKEVSFPGSPAVRGGQDPL